ncbi:hypothetical protein OSB04_021957, partial [Centaurea solstitialis]
MQKGDVSSTAEYSPTTVGSNEGPSFTDIVRVLSHVDLPSPSPVVATSCTLTREEKLVNFHEGQSSSTKKVDEIEVRYIQIPSMHVLVFCKGNCEAEGGQLKGEHENSQEPGTQRVPPSAT